MAIYIRECIQCGAAFKGGPRAWNTIMRSDPPRRCPVCGNDFNPKGPQKYCSKECAREIFKQFQSAYDKNRKRNKDKE